MLLGMGCEGFWGSDNILKWGSKGDVEFELLAFNFKGKVGGDRVLLREPRLLYDSAKETGRLRGVWSRWLYVVVLL